MQRGSDGYHTVTTDRIGAGGHYQFRKDGALYPDPASRFQPDGVHGPSRLVDFRTVPWTDSGFAPPTPGSLVFYELHVGTFTKEGTFATAAARLGHLAGLGVTAVEIMPISEFAGTRNWGYDGVAPYAADSSYGGPLEFAAFVDAAHNAGIAVFLDIVFNHFGPEGNYTGQFGDYQTHKYQSPWGKAVNFDGTGSDEVRSFFIGAADHWMRNCHVDGFRLDAIHEIHDESGVPFLAELTEHVERFSRESGKSHLVIAESDLNDRRVVLSRDSGGLGMHGAWADDFHHAVHAHLTGERNGYYVDFGGVGAVAEAIVRGWCYSWDYSVARQRHHGTDPSGLPTGAFVFCTQNHDQVGNRMLGERLRTLVGPRADRAARTILLLMPYVPLLFMGQEYGEDRPFLYFVDHRDPDLLTGTREGRKREFAAFHASGKPPDPGSPETFRRSILSWPIDNPEADHTEAEDELGLTRHLLGIRRKYDCFRPAMPPDSEVARTAWTADETIMIQLDGPRHSALLVANLGNAVSESTPDRIASMDPHNASGAPRRPLPESLEIVVDLRSDSTKRDAVVPGDIMRLGPFELVAGVWPAGSAKSEK